MPFRIEVLYDEKMHYSMVKEFKIKDFYIHISHLRYFRWLYTMYCISNLEIFYVFLNKILHIADLTKF